MDRSEALRHRLLQMLGSRMEREQSDLVDEIRAAAVGGVQELSDAMTRWEGRLGERQRPESAALGAIFDLDLGMDHLLFAVEGVEAAKDPRTLWVMADMVTVHYFAALERMGDLAKRFQRSGLIDDVVSGWVSKELAFRSDAPILEYRHEVTQCPTQRGRRSESSGACSSMGIDGSVGRDREPARDDLSRSIT